MRLSLSPWQIALGRASQPSDLLPVLLPSVSMLSLAFDERCAFQSSVESVSVYARPTCCSRDHIITYTSPADLPTVDKPLYVHDRCYVRFNGKSVGSWGLHFVARPAGEEEDAWLPYFSAKHKVVESTHSLSCDGEQTEEVRLEGAKALAIFFDPRTSLRQDDHVVSFTPDKDREECLGGRTFTGLDSWLSAYPGCHGREPLIVPASSVVVRFKPKQAEYCYEWGYRVLVLDAAALLPDDELVDDEQEDLLSLDRPVAAPQTALVVGSAAIPAAKPVRTPTFVFPFLENRTSLPQTVRFDMPVRRGVAYFEVGICKSNTPDCLVQIGWCGRRVVPSVPDLTLGGEAAVEGPFSLGLGSTRDSFAIDGVMRRDSREAQKYHNGAAKPFATMNWTAGCVVGCLLNLIEGTISYFLDGQLMGVAFARRDYADECWAKGLVPALSLSPGQAVYVNLGNTPAFVNPSSSLARRAVASVYPLEEGTGGSQVWDPMFRSWEALGHVNQGLWPEADASMVTELTAWSRKLGESLGTKHRQQGAANNATRGLVPAQPPATAGTKSEAVVTVQNAQLTRLLRMKDAITHIALDTVSRRLSSLHVAYAGGRGEHGGMALPPLLNGELPPMGPATVALLSLPGGADALRHGARDFVHVDVAVAQLMRFYSHAFQREVSRFGDRNLSSANNPGKDRLQLPDASTEAVVPAAGHKSCSCQRLLCPCLNRRIFPEGAMSEEEATRQASEALQLDASLGAFQLDRSMQYYGRVSFMELIVSALDEETIARFPVIPMVTSRLMRTLASSACCLADEQQAERAKKRKKRRKGPKEGAASGLIDRSKVQSTLGFVKCQRLAARLMCQRGNPSLQFEGVRLANVMLEGMNRVGQAEFLELLTSGPTAVTDASGEVGVLPALRELMEHFIATVGHYRGDRRLEGMQDVAALVRFLQNLCDGLFTEAQDLLRTFSEGSGGKNLLETTLRLLTVLLRDTASRREWCKDDTQVRTPS